MIYHACVIPTFVALHHIKTNRLYHEMMDYSRWDDGTIHGLHASIYIYPLVSQCRVICIVYNTVHIQLALVGFEMYCI